MKFIILRFKNSAITASILVICICVFRVEAQTGAGGASGHTLPQITGWLVSHLPQICGLNTSINSPDGSVIVELNSKCSNAHFDSSSKILSFSWTRTLEAHAADGSELDLPAYWDRLGNRSEDVSITLSAIDTATARVIDSTDIKAKQVWEVQLGSTTGSKAFVINGKQFGKINLKYFESKEDASKVRNAFIDAAKLAGAPTDSYSPDSSQ